MGGGEKILQINVSQQLKAGVGATRRYDVSDVVDITGKGCESPVRGEVTLTRTGGGILVKGHLETEVELDCSRCLEPFRCLLALDIEEEYSPTIDVTSGLPLTLPEEPGTFTTDRQHTLDLTEAVRQHAVMAIPMKPLCREACRGLCPECGANLNLGECKCRRREADPRWVRLLERSQPGNEEKGEN